MIGGYTWAAKVDERGKTINLDVYLFVSASRTIHLPGGESATVSMVSEMPWEGTTRFTFDAPEGWQWSVRLPKPAYAENVKLSSESSEELSGFLTTHLPARTTVDLTFDMPVRLLAPHPLSGQDTLTVSRGPIVYTAESVDNAAIDGAYPHFQGIGLSTKTTFDEERAVIEGIPVVMLKADQSAYAVNEINTSSAYRAVTSKTPARSWKKLDDRLTFVPWFARANRGGAGRVRTAFLRAEGV
ncbi:hypothetical protein IAU60_004750 [Kwoniella sp. DSM 27419]